MNKSVLDASALLALLNHEAGADQVAAVIPRAALSAVNLAEVVAKLIEDLYNTSTSRGQQFQNFLDVELTISNELKARW